MFIEFHRWWWYFLYNSTAGLKYLEYKPGSELNIFFFEQWRMNNEKQKNWMKTKVEQKMNETQMKIEQWQNKLNNNNKILHIITGTRALCTT